MWGSLISDERRLRERETAKHLKLRLGEGGGEGNLTGGGMTSPSGFSGKICGGRVKIHAQQNLTTGIPHPTPGGNEGRAWERGWPNCSPDKRRDEWMLHVGFEEAVATACLASLWSRIIDPKVRSQKSFPSFQHAVRHISHLSDWGGFRAVHNTFPALARLDGDLLVMPLTRRGAGYVLRANNSVTR